MKIHVYILVGAHPYTVYLTYNKKEGDRLAEENRGLAPMTPTLHYVGSVDDEDLFNNIKSRIKEGVSIHQRSLLCQVMERLLKTLGEKRKEK